MIQQFTPQEQKFSVLLTAATPISHFDPATGKSGNTLSFNRRRQIVRRNGHALEYTQETIDSVTELLTIPVQLVTVFEQLGAVSFTATGMLRLFLDAHNTSAGIGMFEGAARYEGFANRVQQAAIRSDTLLAFWARLSNMLGVSVTGEHYDAILHVLFGLPLGVQFQVLRTIESDYLSLVPIARAWHTMNKLSREEYAEKAGKDKVSLMTMSYSAISAATLGDTVILDVPYISTNDIRHQIRAAGHAHLMNALGIRMSNPGYGDMPHAIAALFENGGNLEQGAKQGSDAGTLAASIRDRFPLLALLGGNLVSFDLGTSEMAVRATIVCTENAPIEDDVVADHSIYDLLDDVTETRQASKAGVGQMIRNFETLAAGTQVHVAALINPFSSDIVRGAAVAAINTWLHHTYIAGQRARGYGHMTGQILQQWPTAADDLVIYESYLANHAAELRSALADGTMGTDKVLAR